MNLVLGLMTAWSVLTLNDYSVTMYSACLLAIPTISFFKNKNDYDKIEEWRRSSSEPYLT